MADVRVDGDVRAILPLPDGSLVVAGYTAYLNGARHSGLMRLQSDGRLVPGWEVRPDDSVLAVATDGSWLYLGGPFRVVNGVQCPFVARVSLSTGAVDPIWRPAPNGEVREIIPQPDGIFLCGAFNNVGGLPRSHLAKVAPAGAGAPLEFWKCDADGQIDDLLLHQGRLYLAGRFTRLAPPGTAVPRSYLARINPVTAEADASWSPNPSFHVYSLAADSTHLYCGGGFMRMGQGGPPFLARVSLSSAAPDLNWAPRPEGIVSAVALSGGEVYAAGMFRRASGQPHYGVLRAPAGGGGAVQGWAPGFDGNIQTLAADGTGGVWAGGRFATPGQAGSGLARLTPGTGVGAPQYLASIENRGAVMALIRHGTHWFAAGDFDSVNGLRRPAIFRMSAGGAVDPVWDARLSGPYPKVHAMVLAPDGGSGPELVIGGQFDTSTTPLIYNLARLRASDGSPLPTFVPNPDNAVRAIVHAGTHWLIGGSFRFIGGRSIPALARISASGAVDAGWQPGLSGTVHALHLQGQELYAGGEFFAAGSLPRQHLVRFPTADSPQIDRAWHPAPDGPVFSIASSESSLFIGGRFTKIGRQRRPNLAQLLPGGAGAATSWNPSPGQQVNVVKVLGDRLYAGGEFFTIAGFVWPKLARFELGTLALDQNFRSTGEDGKVFVLERYSEGELWVGGSFTGWDDDCSKRSLVLISGSGGSPMPAPVYGPAQEPEGGAEEFLAGYLAPQDFGGGQPLAGQPGLVWEEHLDVPAHAAARVQWSHDLKSWHESGASVDGVTRTVIISAEGPRRTAIVSSAGDWSGPLYLRLAIETGREAQP